ncbi:MAG TPA: SDR family NAD(P)-dependent oxidoreductase [Chloroflexota bacterium]|jgi:NAD(P)-dependent dehydrogenase (short-subunit alcohol dehydrogenase family)
MGKLDGKVVLLTGSSPNINGGIALGLAAEGAKLVCVDIQPDYAEACAEDVRKRGGQAIAVTCDVTKEDQVKAAIGHAREELGGVDVLVNGAVIQIRKGIREMAVEEFRRQVDVILAGVFLFTKHAAELMIDQRRKGCIINIISTEGHQGNPGNIGYGTCKSGLLNFTRAVAMELAEFGIRVNSLTPTGTDPAEGHARAAEWGVKWEIPGGGIRRAGYAEGDVGVPLGKRPSPRHYAKAAVFLASDDSEMITGFDLRVDGGTIARYWRWNPGAAQIIAE